MDTSNKASDKVFNFIEEKIIAGVWKKGDRIDSENSLAEQLGVSRVSVREAIGKLAAMGILRKKKGGGSFVEGINPSGYMDTLLPFMILGEGDYVEILELRLSIDVLAIKLFMEGAEFGAGLKKLEKILKEMKSCSENDIEFLELDMEFHRIIVEGTGNSLMKKIYTMILNIMGHHAKKQYFTLSFLERIREHEKIYESLQEGDIEVAQIFMKRHLERTIKDLKKN